MGKGSRARQSTLSKRIDENLFAFWIKLPPAASGFGGRHPRFSSAFTHPRAERLDRCDPRTLDVSREVYSTRTVSFQTVARALASRTNRTHASSSPASFLRETKFSRSLQGEKIARGKEEKKIVNETTLARCELRAHLCCSSTRSEHSSRLTRKIATRMPFLF